MHTLFYNFGRIACYNTSIRGFQTSYHTLSSDNRIISNATTLQYINTVSYLYMIANNNITGRINPFVFFI